MRIVDHNHSVASYQITYLRNSSNLASTASSSTIEAVVPEDIDEEDEEDEGETAPELEPFLPRL